jgi:hypothetical protein
MDRSIEVLAKVRSALLANSTLNTLIGGRVLFAVPQQTAYPFIIARIEMTPNDTKTELAGDYLLRIQAFDDSLDQKKILQIKAEIYNSLHRQEEDIDLNGLVQCIQKGINQTIKESDLKTWIMTVDYRLSVEG